ncbi:SDR family NAD(P)-dependent oxidoreductase (plasmid) [Rathayibacter sp. VKM Ac-2803]|uniref:Short-chain dehydrogenase n=1 Tax=Rathayibacter caricis DSM 15933 TaxID=1328867 RepID=A0A2T4UPD0_9MICO|nr:MULTISPECIES: SDR family NAD(P)-dependent oxidoreductase [Rathayibacter]MWV51541.1 SDR family NAD(P)-dependent oxidoreductase [Rathayibacter sp. VKM Ac-2803]PTL71361.1 short-chain dehydrogenase [Rathayibacter caricis DSM 15933]
MQIADRVFAVTGGGNGIGREVVLALLAKGGHVAALDLDADGLAETVRLAGSDRLSVHPVNISDRAAVESLPDDILVVHRSIDGLINVAGIIQPFVKIAELEYGTIERVMNVNFWGVVNTTKTFLPHLLERPEASIVNVSSMGALTPVPGQAAYGASKAAVKLFTEALFAELQGTRVAATIVFPGAIGTNITANSGVTMPTMTAPGGKAPKPTTPAEAARRIVGAVEKGSYRVVIGKDVTFLDRLSRLAPKRATLLLANQMKALLK